jgi:aminoglycoside/choline kinase family phosphotransferase
MAERDRIIDAFLAAQGWSGAARTPLAGDASSRRYVRLAQGGARAVLMDSRHEAVAPFLRAARRLEDLGLSAPRLLAEDAAERLLLLEDFGDLTFTCCLETGEGADEATLYAAAVDLLAALAAMPAGGDFPAMDRAYLAAEIRLFAEWWPPDGGRNLASGADAWVESWRGAHALALALPSGLALRDFHAGNLMWLAERGGIARVGLLDFQDAVTAPVAYDLVSLLKDVRRDVPPALEAAMVTRFLAACPTLDGEAFRAAYAILGAHRNLRIAGVFARLARRDGKRAYLDFLPRVWRHIQADLAHPALAPVADWLAHHGVEGGAR